RRHDVVILVEEPLLDFVRGELLARRVVPAVEASWRDGFPFDLHLGAVGKRDLQLGRTGDAAACALDLLDRELSRLEMVLDFLRAHGPVARESFGERAGDRQTGEEQGGPPAALPASPNR